MLEKALQGTKAYWIWVISLLAVIGIAFLFYLKQYNYGLGVTGLSRDVTWGFYIAQFTFLVGVAASAVMVVLPYYLHNFKEFGKITILGEFLAIASVIMCMTFIFVDMGQPFRIFNMFLHPSPNSLMFWDSVAMGGGLAARPFWMTAVLAPRFLASAFSSGPALLILLCLTLRKFTRFDPGQAPIQKLAMIATYAMVANVFFILMEIFTVAYSNIPEHLMHFQYLFFGLEGKAMLVPWMWVSAILAVIALILLLYPKTRKKEATLVVACITVFISIWIDKGMAMVVGGFVPNPLGTVTEYFPTLTEVMISLGVYAMGILIVTGLYKIALSIRGEVKA